MFKKSLCIALALLLSISICACSRARQQAASEAVSQSATTAAAGEQSSPSSSGKDKDTAATKKGETTTTEKGAAADKGGANAGGSADKGGGNASGGQQGAAGKQTTTKKQQPATQKKTNPPKSTVDASFTINCSAAVGEVEGVPGSGYFLRGAGVSVSKGASVYDALLQCCEANGVAVVASNTMYGMYVSSIGGLAEKEVGKMSGWTYTVNGNYPPKACDKYTLSDGDHVEFIYKAG